MFWMCIGWSLSKKICIGMVSWYDTARSGRCGYRNNRLSWNRDIKVPSHYSPRSWGGLLRSRHSWRVVRAAPPRGLGKGIEKTTKDFRKFHEMRSLKSVRNHTIWPLEPSRREPRQRQKIQHFSVKIASNLKGISTQFSTIKSRRKRRTRFRGKRASKRARIVILWSQYRLI